MTGTTNPGRLHGHANAVNTAAGKLTTTESDDQDDPSFLYWSYADDGNPREGEPRTLVGVIKFVLPDPDRVGPSQWAAACSAVSDRLDTAADTVADLADPAPTGDGQDLYTAIHDFGGRRRPGLVRRALARALRQAGSVRTAHMLHPVTPPTRRSA